jgi:sulfur carrier protein
MVIILNGQPQPVRDDLSLAELVEFLELTGRRLAVEVNLEVVPRSAYADYRLHPSDRVEVVHAIGGG